MSNSVISWTVARQTPLSMGFSIAIPFSKGLPNPGIAPRSPALQADSLPSEPQGKLYIQRKTWSEYTCTSTSTTALCTTAKTWKEPKCPSTEEQIQKMWWIHTVEHYAAIKNKETMPFVVSWIDLEIVKSDRGEISKGIFYMQNLKRNICCCLVTELCPTLLKPYGLGPHGL